MESRDANELNEHGQWFVHVRSFKFAMGRSIYLFLLANFNIWRQGCICKHISLDNSTSLQDIDWVNSTKIFDHKRLLRTKTIKWQKEPKIFYVKETPTKFTNLYTTLLQSPVMISINFLYDSGDFSKTFTCKRWRRVI